MDKRIKKKRERERKKKELDKGRGRIPFGQIEITKALERDDR